MLWLLGQFGDGGTCGTNFLAFPTWYHYLGCSADISISSLNDIWLIVAAIIEILLRVSSLVAIAFIIYGGFQYLTSQGEPDKTNRARQTLMNAVIGLIIAILAAVIVNFIASSITT